MNALNSLLIEGNLTNDPTITQTPSGATVCNFSIATNRYYKDRAEEVIQETSFFDVTAWAKLAEACEKNARKGRAVRVVGRIKQERWTTDEGKTNSRVVIVAEHIEFKPILKASPENTDSTEE